MVVLLFFLFRNHTPDRAGPLLPILGETIPVRNDAALWWARAQYLPECCGNRATADSPVLCL